MVDILHFASLVKVFLRCRPHTDEIYCSYVVDVVLSRLHLKKRKGAPQTIQHHSK